MNKPSYHLYHYWRSSSSWRVRIALAWKQIPYSETAVGLLNGESESVEHLKRNPAGFVPVLELKDGPHAGSFLTESLAIIRYLEESHPENKFTLLPGDAFARAKIMAMVEVINSAIQPFQNISVLAHFSKDTEEQKKWAKHWIHLGLSTFEHLSAQNPGNFSYGNQFTLADVFLIPQLYSAERFGMNLDEFPRIQKAHASSQDFDAVLKSHPDCFKPIDSSTP